MIPKRFVTGQRKSWALAFVGLYHLGYAGIALLDRPGFDPSRAVLYEALPIWLRVTMWTTAGALALVLAPTRYEQVGWAAVMIMPIERLISHLWSAAMYILPGYPPGVSASGSYILRWFAIAALIRLIASWPEPEVKPTLPTEGPPDAA